MDDLPDLLARDFGLRPKGKSAPMAPPAGSSRSRSGSTSEDVFGAPCFSQPRSPSSFDLLFPGSSKASPLPVYDNKPAYDEDIFDGIPGMKSSASARYDDVFASMGSSGASAPPMGDLLENFGRSAPKTKGLSGFEEFIPGFGGSSPPQRSKFPESNYQSASVTTSKSTSNVTGDPFVMLETSTSANSTSGIFTDPLEQISRPMSSGSTKINASPVNGGLFDDIDPFRGRLEKTTPSLTSIKKENGGGHLNTVRNAVLRDPFADLEPRTKSSTKAPYLEANVNHSDNVWLNVSEIPLFTQLTSAPSPSRPPPPLVDKHKSFDQSSRSNENPMQNSGASPIDELEEFAMGRPQAFGNDHAKSIYNEDNFERNSAAEASQAAMKEAMDKAEAKFRHAKEAREKERQARSAKSREKTRQERHDKTIPDPWDLGYREKQERLDPERKQREREEKERKGKRLEEEKELESGRERARQAVERARREAQERAASEARLKFERAAFQRAADEARGRAGRAAVEKTAAQARERDAAQSRQKQQKNENDIESFFGMGARANSAPKQRAATSENFFDAQVQSTEASDAPRRSSSSSSTTIRRVSSTTNIVDDLTSIFGGPSTGEFQEVEGESEERRRARLGRHQRTLDRTAKALAEKNERDMQTMMEQEERHRIAETLDIEIKRWAAGKESNLRALLSTLQYVLWPECGWQPASLTDLITSASVKKVYRKATLCVHPDKVQQKGANLQQKYIAEKVFDLLKEAWNKFNSEELY